MSMGEEFEEKMDVALAQFIVDVGESGFVLSEESQNCFKDGYQVGHQAATEASDAKWQAIVAKRASNAFSEGGEIANLMWQARVKKLEEALRMASEYLPSIPLTYVDSMLANTTSDKSLQRELLEARIDERSKPFYSASLQITRLEELRAQLAALEKGE